MRANATPGTVVRRRLAQRRRAVGLTQEGLAQLLAVDRSTVARWERGETEPLAWIRPKLATTLGVSAERLQSLLAVSKRAESPPKLVRAGVPRQLPAAAADFTGRAAEVATLTQVLDAAGDGAPGTVVISAIGGMAGVGKTALALHWAHQAAPRFPDGQLYVNLRGFDPSGTPVSAAKAIRAFLDALAVPPERIPPSPDAQAGLYRSLLADRRMLVVLDNARDEQQVLQLLPASRDTLVLVTSRNQLAGLAAANGARLLSIDVLRHDEATQLLSARIGPARAAAEPAAVEEIARLCACLPLALAIAAARAAARPRLPLAALADELRDSTARLDALDSGEGAGGVRTVFSWSVEQLSAETARTFRLLGVHPGPDITVPAAASLAGLGESEARRQLSDLTRTHLITEHEAGRYAFHDLLRAYAADQARAIEDQQARDRAVGRVLDHYLHTARDAAVLIKPAGDSPSPPAARPGVAPEHLADRRQAMAWFEAEHHVLLAAVTLADSAGFDVHCWQIPWAMADFMARRGYWQEKAAIHGIALAAATRLGDPAARAETLRDLANARSRLGDHDLAQAHYTACLELCQQLGDRSGEAKVHAFLGMAAERQGRYADALAHARQALGVYQAIGNRPGEAKLLNNVAFAHALLGDYQQARMVCERALTLTAELGLPGDEAHAWDSLGYAQHHMGNLTEAAACYQRALSIFREFGDRYYVADTLTHLGHTLHACGDLPQARDAWQQALSILDDLQHPNANKVRAELASTDG